MIVTTGQFIEVEVRDYRLTCDSRAPGVVVLTARGGDKLELPGNPEDATAWCQIYRAMAQLDGHFREESGVLLGQSAKAQFHRHTFKRDPVMRGCAEYVRVIERKTIPGENLAPTTVHLPTGHPAEDIIATYLYVVGAPIAYRRRESVAIPCNEEKTE